MASTNVRRPAIAAVASLALALGPAAGCGDGDEVTAPTAPAEASGNGKGDELARSDGGPQVEEVATGLEVPWEIAFLPDGRALITERPGRVRILSPEGKLEPRPAAEPPVAAVGEGGLLGLAVDPEFKRNGFVYLYFTTEAGNQVARYRLDGDQLREQATVVEGIQSGAIHDGGRIHFGPDDRLYISTGEVGQENLAQDEASLNGKFLRLDPDDYRGDVAVRPDIASTGHRNPQGFDWQPGSDRLFASEHGPEGDDEVNLVREGRNYGWPEVHGAEEREGLTAPIVVYEEAIAPSGATFVSLPGSAWTGDLLIGALVGEQVRRVSFDGARVTGDEALFEDEFGRVRTVVEGPDGALYALTSNRDGRGDPDDDDDRVLRIIPPAG